VAVLFYYKPLEWAVMYKTKFNAVGVALVTAMFLAGCGNDNGKDTSGKESLSPQPAATFTDSRDGKTYRKVAIGTQTWMGENLNYDTSNSKCYDYQASNCAKYGRLYNWNDATGVCPVGWHLPSDAEWTVLTDYVGGSKTAGTKLKSPQYWNSYGGGIPTGTDEFGFSALPGGSGHGGVAYRNAGYCGYWWSITETEDDSHYAWSRSICYDYESVYKIKDIKTHMFSVRCLQDL
jgi:uncharacterized protein (TIGR02145 family)